MAPLVKEVAVHPVQLSDPSIPGFVYVPQERNMSPKVSLI